MDAERACLYCNLALSDEWARSDQKYCSESCKMKFWYRKRYKRFYDSRYQRLKREWEKSQVGKKAGVPIREWLKLPKDWR